MKRTLIAAFVVLAATAALAAADPQAEARKAAAKAEMAKLSTWPGRWKGEGWMLLPTGKATFDSEETVEARLDGNAYLVEGFHREKGTGAVVHHALGLLAWDVARNEYRLQTALTDGRAGSFPGKIEDGRFVWRMQVPNGPMTRYTINVDAERWVEDGDVSRDGGATWMRIFEMRLTRVK